VQVVLQLLQGLVLVIQQVLRRLMRDGIVRLLVLLRLMLVVEGVAIQLGDILGHLYLLVESLAPRLGLPRLLVGMKVVASQPQCINLRQLRLGQILVQYIS